MLYMGGIILTLLRVYFKHFCVSLCMLQLAEVHEDGLSTLSCCRVQII